MNGLEMLIRVMEEISFSKLDDVDDELPRNGFCAREIMMKELQKDV